MKMKAWFGSGTGIVVAAALLFGACGDDKGSDDSNPLLAGGSTISGTVSVANTDGDTSVSGITVTAESDREVTTTTNGSGGFTLGDAPTGDVTVTFTRGACTGSFVLGQVVSRSGLILQNVTVSCGAAVPGAIVENFRSVIRTDPPGVLTPLDTCVRVGEDNQRRDVDASGAAVTDEAGAAASFDAFADENLLDVTGTRAGVGAAGITDATAITIVEGDVLDPCDL